jgi:uncharacterized protein (TIGR03086 family)
MTRLKVDAFLALSTANGGFMQRLRLVGPNDWGRPTPCGAWDVRALVNHVVGANRRYTMLLAGASPAEVDATRSIDHLGDDAVASFLATASELAAAFREEDALTRSAHHPAGDRTGAQLLGMRVLDVAVHTWDLARALDVDETLDPDVVDFALTLAPTIEASRQSGAFAPPHGALRAAASPQVRLLHLVGRRPLERKKAP